MAAIHEQLQSLNRLSGAQFEDNPMPLPRRVPRPPEVFLPPEEDEDDEEELYTEADIEAFGRENFAPDK